MKSIQIGTKFYDERNDRYVTVCKIDPVSKVYSCIVDELNDNGEYEKDDMYLFTEPELRHMKEV